MIEPDCTVAIIGAGPGGIAAAKRLSVDLRAGRAFLVAPLVHLLARLPGRLLIRLLPLYDGYCRGLYRLLQEKELSA